MKKILPVLTKYFIVYFQFAKNSLMGCLEYRTNFFIMLGVECIYLISKLLYVVFVYKTDIVVNGVTPDGMMLFIGTFILMTAIYTGLFMDNFYQLPEHVRNGSLDMFITKPVSLQFMVTTRRLNFALPIPNIIAGIIMVITACRRIGIDFSAANIAGYIGMLISGTFVAYAVFLFPQVLSFWTVKTNAITEIADKCWDFNNMPMLIYKKWLQRIGTFFIPLFFITNIPAMYLLKMLKPGLIIWTIAAPVLFMVLIRLFWKHAVKSYSSASS